MKTRTAVHCYVDPHTIDSFFFVFPSDVCSKKVADPGEGPGAAPYF